MPLLLDAAYLEEATFSTNEYTLSAVVKAIIPKD